MKVGLFLGAFLGWLLGALSVRITPETPASVAEDRVRVSFFRDLPPQAQSVPWLRYDSENDLVISKPGASNLFEQVRIASDVICVLAGAGLGAAIGFLFGRSRRRPKAFAVAVSP
jgi:hypothetical protein